MMIEKKKCSKLSKKRKTRFSQSVIEKFLLPNPQWQEGYQAFNLLLGKSLGWIVALDDHTTSRILRLDRKGNCPFYARDVDARETCETFFTKYAEQLSHNEASAAKLPLFYKCPFGRNSVIFPMKYLGTLRGFLIICSLHKHEREVRAFLTPFNCFITSQVELAYKNFELNNFYETVHPRALALSTMHSVHRVISSSLRLKDLLPRIGRLSAQILKAQGCSIMLVGHDRKYLIPSFSFGTASRFVHSHKVIIGRGFEGRIADTGEFCLHKKYVGIPYIENDVVGVITLWDKAGNQSFTKIDLEILKSISEQAVVAIKNAQLFEQTEELTLGSIKTINELLERHFGGSRSHLVIVGEIVLETGKMLGLSSRELIQMERAILLLDTGQLAMPDKVWRKKDKLTKKEYALMKRIPAQGADLLKSITSLKPVIPIIMYRHERFDGKGYPEGLKGAEIPIGARVVSVVDSFMAMVLKRSYRSAFTVQEALSEIEKHKNTQFDPNVVKCFLRVMEDHVVLTKINRMLKIKSKK